MAETIQLFLCHAPSDAPRVRAIADALKKLGVEAWLDEREEVGGAPLSDYFPPKLASCAGLVFCASEASMKSERVRRELAYAADKELLIIPVNWDPRLDWAENFWFAMADPIRVIVVEGEENSAAEKTFNDAITVVVSRGIDLTAELWTGESPIPELLRQR